MSAVFIRYHHDRRKISTFKYHVKLEEEPGFFQYSAPLYFIQFAKANMFKMNMVPEHQRRRYYN